MKKFFLAALTLLILAALPAFAKEPPTEYESFETPAQIEEATEFEEATEPEEATEFEDATEFEEETEPENVKIPAPEIENEWINLYIDNALIPPVNRVLSISSALFVPAEDTATLLGLDAKKQQFTEKDETLVISGSKSTAYLFADSCYAIINGEPLDLKLPCYDIGGVFYAPLFIFTDTFGIEERLDTAVPNPDLYLTSLLSEKAGKYAKRVNGLKLKSDTDYLIWVSKGDFSVRLFKKSSGGWVFEREFPCAIGAPATPTCEGVFKFYERVTAWNYDDYYVGPVMRFNGGYALHSVLLNYDGTPRSRRVGVRVSHGCVRLLPEDINYLYGTVPLYTTVYVSAQ